MFKCKRCDGEGYTKCPQCEGEGFLMETNGYIWIKPAITDSVDYHEEDCSPCNGTGIKKCRVCEGDGKFYLS
jgi:RecJ-like exonuclease